jgi:exonuclease VII large subunit
VGVLLRCLCTDLRRHAPGVSAHPWPDTHSIARVRGGERGRLEGDRRVLQVSDVLRAIEDQFSIAFPRRVWVFGTVRALRGTDDLEFLLTEASAELTGEAAPQTLPTELEAAALADVDASLRRLHDVAVEDLLVEGHLVRAGGLLSYDVTRHTIVFSITALDPQPTSAWLDDRRQAVREAIEEARLAERQRDVQVPLAPRFIGVVGQQDDPTLADVTHKLTSGGFDVEVTQYPVRETGARIVDGLANALREAGLGGHDVVLLIREFGRPLALAPYDAEGVIRAVAISPVPILTGLGAPEAPAAVESVAHMAFPTGAEAAEALLRKLNRAADLIDEAVERVSEAGDEALRRAALRVEQTRHSVVEDLRQARGRAQAARKRRLLRVRSAAAVLAVLIVLAAVLTGAYVILVALVVPLALAAFSERLRPQRRRGPVSVTGMSFAAALQRLGNIRHDLDEVADPDVVDSLENEASTLAEHCRSLLRRPRSLRARQLQSIPTEDSVSGAQPFDQYAGSETPVVAPLQDDDATVAIPSDPPAPPRLDDAPGDVEPAQQSSGAGAGADTEAAQDAPTEAIAEAPRRTITLPGDAPTVGNHETARSDDEQVDDDSPTGILHPPR